MRQVGAGLPIAVSVVAIAMGLNLLEALPLRLPSLDVDVRRLAAPPLLQVRRGPSTRRSVQGNLALMCHIALHRDFAVEAHQKGVSVVVSLPCKHVSISELRHLLGVPQQYTCAQLGCADTRSLLLCRHTWRG